MFRLPSWQNPPMRDAPAKPEGLRERKRRQTLQRIAEVGLKMFLAKGYEATTLDEIAAEAGISRRTFFHYFESKDEILLAHLGSYADALKAAVLAGASAGPPVDVVRGALLTVVGSFQEPEMIAIARLMRESGALRTRRFVSYLQFEQAIHEGLCELWPDDERRDGLRLVTIASVGVLRFATESWLQQNGEGPLAQRIVAAFEALKAEIRDASPASLPHPRT